MRPQIDTLNIECLVQSLQNVIEAKQKHDKARDEYEGYSWGYYGQGYIDAMTHAADDFEKRLVGYIDAAVVRQVDALMSQPPATPRIP